MFEINNRLVSLNIAHTQKICDALINLLDNIFIMFDTELCRRIVGIPMGTNCAPLIAHLVFFAIKEILWPLFLIIKKLILFKH